MDKWEDLHTRRFGEGPWIRVYRMAWHLVRHHIGQEDLADPANRRDVPRTEIDEVWVPVTQLLALAWYQQARYEGALVDEVAVEQALPWLVGARAGDLFSRPPAGARRPVWTGTCSAAKQPSWT